MSPEKIVLSGGVLLRKVLFPKIRIKTQEYLNSYINVPSVVTSKGIDKLIVPSKHGNDAGIVGALYLAKMAHQEKRKRKSIAASHVRKAPWFVSFLAGIAVATIASAAFSRR